MADDLSRLIDGMRPEEKALALEYFAGGDPDGFREAAREARLRYERADGYREQPDQVTVRRADLDLVMNHAGNPATVADYPAACQRIRDALAVNRPPADSTDALNRGAHTPQKERP